jgi:hypothetical protein
MSGKIGLHQRGNCECSADGSYQDERCAWFEEGHEQGTATLRTELAAAKKLVADMAEYIWADLGGPRAEALLSRARDCEKT